MKCRSDVQQAMRCGAAAADMQRVLAHTTVVAAVGLGL